MTASLARILIIEDDRTLAAQLGELLRGQGYATLTSHLGESGLNIALNEQPDLLLLDVMLPEIDGVTLLRQLAGLVDLQQTPVVLLTGHLERERLTELQQMGVREVLQKPFDPLQLTAQLRAIWEAEHE